MPYKGSHIWQLRQKIGHDLLLMPGMSAVIENEAGEILLGCRADFKKWGLISGSQEPGQGKVDNLIAEMQEETGLTPIKYEPFGYLSDPNIARTLYPNGDQLQYSDVLFHVTAWEGELINSDQENTALEFFSLDSLPELYGQANYKILELLAEYKRTGKFQLS